MPCVGCLMLCGCDVSKLTLCAQCDVAFIPARRPKACCLLPASSCARHAPHNCVFLGSVLTCGIVYAGGCCCRARLHIWAIVCICICSGYLAGCNPTPYAVRPSGSRLLCSVCPPACVLPSRPVCVSSSCLMLSRLMHGTRLRACESTPW